jgi:hypothetical protein
MRVAVPRKFPFASEVGQPRPERAEPRLLPLNEPRPFGRAVSVSRGNLSATQDEDRNFAPPLAISAIDRPPAPAAARPIGSPFHLVLAGVVILAIGAVGGVAFLRFIGPAQESVTAALPAAATSPQADGKAGPVSPPASMPHPAAAAIIPSPPLARHAEAANAAPKSPQAGAAAVPAPASGHAPDRPTAIAAKTKAAAAATGLVRDHRAVSPSASDHRFGHTRIAARHAHPGPLREAGPLKPPPRSARSSALRQSERPSRSARSSGTASDQAASFARLMTQLTEPTKPADQSLSPPAAAAADPFAPRNANGSAPQ